MQMKVVETAYHTVSVDRDASLSTLVYIYEHSFNPISPFENLLAQGSPRCLGSINRLIAYLHVSTSYIVVATTSFQNMQGNFTIQAFGPSEFSFVPFGT
jgi:hypothetical protein